MHLRIYHGQLKLFRARKADAGAYSCHASNKAGTAAKNVILRFIEEPKIDIMVNYTLVEEFDTYRITCHASGRVKVSIENISCLLEHKLQLALYEVNAMDARNLTSNRLPIACNSMAEK